MFELHARPKRRFWLRKLLSFILKRIPVGSPARREIVTRALEELPEVAHYRLRDIGFAPGGIIDVGAHVGDWTRSIRRVFPKTPILMIEAREAQKRVLEDTAAALGAVDVEIALLAADPGKSVPFHVQDTGSSLFAERSNYPRTTMLLPTTTLDEAASRGSSLKPPLFVKLDVQGAELEVLRGGRHTLSAAEIVQIEVQLLHYNEGAPSAADTIAFMDEAGFAVFDVAEMTRTNGADLMQMDLIFANKDSSLRRDFFRY